MKFALIALVASASAIQIRGAPCVSMDQSNEVFAEIDTNHNGQIGRAEGEAAVRWFLKSHPNFQPSAAQVHGAEDAVVAAAGADHQLNPVEFNHLANELCAYVEAHH